ncbi:uncharacterized protein CBO05P1_248 [Clostridium botulinum B str. Osaka05]|uniref:Uncharacterized protein n=1 Tax=Clostridium botulinum B str. Osaka05 TaxID=1407017 RepID=A0A060N523_CLOBO|nr:hypothetical protein [Clostridium botulinum]BAO04967.1 uncharacterized protein CBO05P1_248 [Clostridium botulinum B str. Osaka05]
MEHRKYEIRILPDGREIKVYTDVLERLKERKSKEWSSLMKSLNRN